MISCLSHLVKLEQLHLLDLNLKKPIKTQMFVSMMKQAMAQKGKKKNVVRHLPITHCTSDIYIIHHMKVETFSCMVTPLSILQL